MKIQRDDLYPDIYGLYLYYLDKGSKEGLTKKDFYSIRKIKEDIDCLLVQEDNKWTDLYYKLEDLLDEIYQSGIVHKYSYETMAYLNENAYILPLVLANDDKKEQIKMYSDASYYFSCQFHIERTPSMGVCDDKNYFYCFGCGVSGSAINYLMEYENISFKEALELLSEIYLISPKPQTKKHKKEVIKYQKTIIGPEYQELLARGKSRLKRRNQDRVGNQDVEVFYQKRYATIERIKAGEYAQGFTIKENSKHKRLYLK